MKRDGCQSNFLEGEKKIKVKRGLESIFLDSCLEMCVSQSVGSGITRDANCFVSEKKISAFSYLYWMYNECFEVFEIYIIYY